MKHINLHGILRNKVNLIMLATIMFYVMYLGLGSNKAYALITLPIMEDFETPSSDSFYQVITNNWRFSEETGSLFWYRVPSGDNTGVTTGVTTVSAHGGNYMARADVYSAPNQGDSSRLYTSESFSLPTTDYYEYSLWMYHYPELYDGDGNNDSIQPQILQDGGTWVDIGSKIYRVNGTTGWSKHTISLSSYRGKTVKVGLLAYGDYAYNMYVDDISINTTTPANLTATSGNGQVNLSWDSVLGATGYKVYKRTTAEAEYSQVYSGSDTSYTATGLANGTSYYFVVTASTGATGESTYSNVANATPQSTVPSAPANLTATEGNGQVSLSWDSVTGATIYKVYQSSKSGTDYSEVYSGTNASYTATGLSNSTSYYFVVTVTTDGGVSLYSNEVSAMSSVPSAPTNLTATAGDGQVSLSWDSVTGATSYKVYKRTAETSYTQVYIGSDPSVTSYTATGLSNSTPYYFVVKASRTTEDSPNSDEVCSTPLNPIVPVGAGTEANPYIIDNPYGLIWMSANIATVKASYFKQIADIDMTGVKLTPIGNISISFTGTYDGCGRNISNLTMRSDLTSVGLFGIISSPGVVKYLTLTNANIKCTSSSNSQIGGIAGLSSGTIESCNLIGSSFIEGAENSVTVGSLVGSNDHGTINNCYSTATITGHSSSSIGGIVGYSKDSSTQTCYFAGTITGDAGTKIGGIIGNTNSSNTITDNYFLNTATTNGIGSTASNDGATPITEANLKKQATFNNWDFSTVWYINEDTAYPVLRAPAPYASDILLTLNPVGTNDTVTVSGRNAGEIVKIYDAQTGGTLLGNATVPAAQTSVSVDIGKLTASSIYVSLTSLLRPEGGRTQKAPVYIVTVGVTAPDQGTVSGGGTYTKGQSVTLSAAPAADYNFDGWYSGTTLVSSQASYTFTSTQDIYITAYFTSKYGELIVTTASGGSVSLDGVAIGVIHQVDSVARDTQITLIATPASGYTFGYWENTRNSSIVSTVATYETYIGSGTDLTAVFFPVNAGGPFTVVFKDKSGKILQSNEIQSGQQATEPFVPALLGYTHTDWNKSFANVTSNLIISAVYERESAPYVLSVGNGTLSGGGTSGSYQFDLPVTVVARTAESGEQFSHWEQDGVKVSIKSTYSFFMPMSNTALTAVFVALTTTLINTPFISLSNLQFGSNTLLATAKQDVPADYTIVESGVLLLQADSCSDLTLGTAGAIRTKTRADSTDQFYIRKSDISGKWFARGYLIYKDGSNIVTVYSDNILNGTI